MPSRRAIALVVAFWVASTSYVAYRDLWPVLFASGPPPVAIDLADEAAQAVPVRWTIHFGGQRKPGKLVTQMKYHEADDTFAFRNRYTDIRYEAAGAVVAVPELTSVVRVSRSGDLREQTVDGKLELTLPGGTKLEGSAKVVGRVEGGLLKATCDVRSPLLDMRRSLEPVPVPRGQPLNALQPVNRIAGVHPGRRWVVHESDPLQDALRALVKEKLGEYGLRVPDEKREPLVGEVLSDRRTLDWNGEAVSCRVIEYRRGDELAARTWVRESDGKVLKQEAFHKGDTVTVVRDY